jgi:hypothetical protein
MHHLATLVTDIFRVIDDSHIDTHVNGSLLFLSQNKQNVLISPLKM